MSKHTDMFIQEDHKFEFPIVLKPLGKAWIYFPSSYVQIVGETRLFNLGIETGLGEGKLWIQTC